MASTNKTENIGLSQFLATDKPSWLTDYNNDMGKIDESVLFKAKYDPQGKNEDVFAYADKILKNYVFFISNTGKDTNAGTEEAPLATIKEAFDRTPVICNSLKIILKPGGYGEQVIQSNRVFVGGLTIVGGSDLASAVNYTVRSFCFSNITGPLNVTGITANNYNGGSGAVGFELLNVPFTILRYCIAEGALSGTTTGVRSQFGSDVMVLECRVSNKTYAVVAYNSGKIASRGLTGSNNIVAFSAGHGGENKVTSGNVITATTLYSKDNGGIVVKQDGTLA